MGKSILFINNIQKKIKKDSQYQLKEIYNWTFYLKYLQSILIEFDLATVPIESTMVKYFEKRLKFSIKAEMDQNAI